MLMYLEARRWDVLLTNDNNMGNYFISQLIFHEIDWTWSVGWFFFQTFSAVVKNFIKFSDVLENQLTKEIYYWQYYQNLDPIRWTLSRHKWKQNVSENKTERC